MSTTSTALQALVQPATSAYALTAGRFWSLVAALVGLAGVVIGGFAQSGSARRRGLGRRGAVIALVAGATGAVIGGLVVGAAEGGPGTGYGLVGGFVAVAVGLVAVVLGGVALVHTRRTTDHGRAEDLRPR